MNLELVYYQERSHHKVVNYSNRKKMMIKIKIRKKIIKIKIRIKIKTKIKIRIKWVTLLRDLKS